MIFEPSEFELAKFDYLASSEFHDFQHKWLPSLWQEFSLILKTKFNFEFVQLELLKIILVHILSSNQSIHKIVSIDIP
jgi:hypothetical protein